MELKLNQIRTTQILDTSEAVVDSEATTPKYIAKLAYINLPMLTDSRHVSKQVRNNQQGTL